MLEPGGDNQSPGGLMCWRLAVALRLIEAQHRVGDFAAFHRAEGFVYVFELAAPADHRRIIFRFQDGKAYDANLVDYH